MERKQMSAFSMYQTLPAGLSSAGTKRSLQLASKKKKRVNDNVIPARQGKKKKMKAKNHAAEVAIPRLSEPKCVNAGEDALNVLLAELAQINNSKERASKLFQWLINPIPSKAFFRETWEKKPVLVQRKNPNYYKGLFSTEEFDRILRQEDVQYGVNLDVTSYTDGKRETHNPPGRALPYTVWDFYESGCSLRMLNPQAFSSTVWNVLSILQEHFGSMAGANVYLTPAGTQGFAPHYDDIEAFVIQLEGKKHWRVYNPRSDDEVLPVLSSPNFTQAEIGKPILEVVLEAGDLLYFPRGFIHQGDCLSDAHSLHITVSSYQKNSWGDLLQKMVPTALEIAMEEDVEFRQGLPLDYLSYMGVQNSDKDDPRRAVFFSKIDNLMNKLRNFSAVDAAVDLKAREFLHDCLPPKLTAEEAAGSVHEAPARWEDGSVKDVGAYITSQTRVGLLRAGCARLCSDGDAVHLYYTTDNSRVYHKEEPKSFEIKPEVKMGVFLHLLCFFFQIFSKIFSFIQYTDAVEFLIHSYPQFVSVGSFPCDSMQEKISLAELLFKNGVIRKESLP
ncbi:ribosomal oxygenase 1 isoform X1 [Syngnathus scovelli]|uniref:ribosomal oxygenase 1 isoform X1 n=1 Tax=Syngnathus scovelli TaxID=161590 RepID=UPI002110A63C|nr:ribosomal oxygenase 1 isoform X1 [Syngnathus scovelli]